MKELSIEEKAKAYDEAKLRMSAAYNSNRCTIGFMNEIFPELAKSEGERIRKELISYIKSSGAITNQEWIAWLEKQGEQKPTEWSEEDEKMMDIILNDINYAQKNFSDSKLTSYDKKVEWLKNKLKSLRYDVKNL